VAVRAAGVDRGAWHVMTGLPYLGRLRFGLRRPRNRVRGLDVAGTVQAVGTNVTRFHQGNEVFGTCRAPTPNVTVHRPEAEHGDRRARPGRPRGAGRSHARHRRVFPLAEVPEAIRYVAGGHARGKVVVTV
jgi:NADPH:quinone reductase-like Zn-dependent oxidoreductase